MNSDNNTLLSSAYLAPIQYYSQIAKSATVYIEAFENYVKQTYRNRCEIYGANGKMTLSIPIKKNTSTKTSIKDIVIDYSTSWQRLHWISIESAYRSSPFFEFYMDEFYPFYEKKIKYLFDFNFELLETVMSILDIETELIFTDDFIPLSPNNENDYRYSIHPKNNKSQSYNMPEYVQVFNNKYGFIPNLSIIDLICSEGPNAESFLK